uniref:N-acetylgalactosamine-N, N'-diacetylbacillosaminyl-diphospho-undecaprenol 4-alpha-N-acetylgalactosaminyltransferase n=1 Tax=Vibrio parahaemolyticus TaxID=670 RepID=A0A7M1W8Z0_VIBPH|nr:N-acetylgalactosamine-N,N'-diacetylbacillosaminyl-diphospho-undecaprenol 4-alpha-N-acetylgalactosaminyltransferase [Vibrio parahaemolyticus]
MTHIVFAVPTNKIGGAERIIYNLVSHLSSNIEFEVSVIFICRSFGPSIWDALESRTNVSLSYGSSHRELYSLPGFISRLVSLTDVDIMFSSHININSCLCLLRRLRIIRTKRLIIRESAIHNEVQRGINKRVFDFYYLGYGAQDTLVCQTDEMSSSLETYLSKAKVKGLKTLPNPVDINGIQRSVSHHSASDSSVSIFRICLVGRLHTIKNQKLVIESLSLLKETHNFKLDIIGDGQLREELEQKVTEAGVHKFVHFHGFQSNPYKLMHNADLGVLSSTSEGYPNVILEMMTSGVKNIVSTPCCPALSHLPNVTISRGFSAVEFAALIAEAIDSRADFSSDYSKFVATRSIDQYCLNLDICK